MRVHLIETMRAEGGEIPLWEWHRRRLLGSAEALGWPLLKIKKPEAELGMIRMLAFETGEIRVEHHALPVQPVPYRVGLSPVVVNPSDPWLRHKSSRRAPYDAARVWARQHGLHDALLRNREGALTESTIGTLLAEVDGVWYTPPVSDGLVAGVMRAVLLSEGRLYERSLRADDLSRAGALYLCNAVRGVFPITLTGEGDGRPVSVYL